MMAEFLHFYPGYTVESALSMYAVTFYALVTAMYQVQGRLSMARVIDVASALNGKALESRISELQKQSAGLTGILEEVRHIKQLRKK